MIFATKEGYFKSWFIMTLLPDEDTDDLFFGEPTVESLQRILESFNPTSFSPDACRRRAGQFSRAQFEAGIRSAIETTMAGSREQKTGGSQCTTI